jgi:hypothetical protein
MSTARKRRSPAKRPAAKKVAAHPEKLPIDRVVTATGRNDCEKLFYELVVDPRCRLAYLARDMCFAYFPGRYLSDVSWINGELVARGLMLAFRSNLIMLDWPAVLHVGSVDGRVFFIESVANGVRLVSFCIDDSSEFASASLWSSSIAIDRIHLFSPTVWRIFRDDNDAKKVMLACVNGDKKDALIFPITLENGFADSAKDFPLNTSLYANSSLRAFLGCDSITFPSRLLGHTYSYSFVEGAKATKTDQRTKFWYQVCDPTDNVQRGGCMLLPSPSDKFDGIAVSVPRLHGVACDSATPDQCPREHYVSFPHGYPEKRILCPLGRVVVWRESRTLYIARACTGKLIHQVPLAYDARYNDVVYTLPFFIDPLQICIMSHSDHWSYGRWKAEIISVTK